MSHEQREGHTRATKVKSALRERLIVLQQLHDELVEDLLETQRGTSQLMNKIRSSGILPLLDDCEAKLREMRGQQTVEREKAEKLAELLRGATRALVEAPRESIKMIATRLPSAFGWALIRYANRAQGTDVDKVFDEIKEIRKISSAVDNLENNGGKRKRAETSDDDGEDGSERVGEGPGGGTRIHIRDINGGVHDGGAAGSRDLPNENQASSTNETSSFASHPV